MVSRLDNALAFQSQALNLRAHRQQVLAANIANADTPHYKARDFDFKAALGEALAGRRIDGLAIRTTSDRHLTGTQAPATAALRFRAETQSAVDGNTVDMDVERAEFSDNAIHYEASITFVNGILRSMSEAMQPVR